MSKLLKHLTRSRVGATQASSGLAVALLLAAGSVAPAQAQEETPGEMPSTLNSDHVSWLTETFTKAAPAVLSAFSTAFSNASSSVVTVLADGNAVALGAIVESDGLLLTKASQLDGERITCRLPDGRHLRAAVLGEDDEQDLALLKIAASDLVPVTWREGDVPSPGHWVITPGRTHTPVAIGVVSARERSWRMRRRDKPRGFLGVQLEAGESNTVRVVRVIDGLAADKAGIEPGDVITHIDDDAMSSVDELIRRLGGTPPDTTVALRLLRTEQAISVNASLGQMPSRSPELRWGGGPFSERRYEFPNVLPHDTTLLPVQCGGPLLDLQGRGVGINIARALRVASYALTARDVQRTLAELKAKASTEVEVSAEPVTDDTPAQAADVAAEGEPAGDEERPQGDGDVQLARQWIKAIHDRDADAVANVTEEFIERFPRRKVRFMVRSAQVFLGHLNEYERGYEIAHKLADNELGADAKLLNEISWFIFTDRRVEERDIDCGMKLARLAVERSRGRDAAILDTLARGHVEQGDLEQAIKIQKRALKRARGQNKAVIEETLDRYKQARHSI